MRSPTAALPSVPPLPLVFSDPRGAGIPVLFVHGMAASPREFVSGETFLYLGRQYRLRVERGRAGGDARVRLVRGHLVVSIPDRGAQAPHVREQLIAWYRGRATNYLPTRVAHWAPELRVEPKAVLIRDQRRRWGSADAKGNLRLNWRLVQAPLRLVDYVVVHELAHLRHAGHGRDFWAAVARVIPDCEVRRMNLKVLGLELGW